LLVLAGTPLGDPRDAPARLADLLAGAEVVAAEDTRRLRRLCDALGVRTTGRVVSYFEGNETARTPDLLAALLAGATVVVLTDAGMPSVSDPGYRLVVAAAEARVRVTAVPGPSAVLTALALSALPVDRFCFEGFLPRKAGERARVLKALADEQRTMVFFEAPHRIAASLSAMAGAFGAERAAAVCRELTKTHEEVRRGPLAELAAWAEAGLRGEITVVVQGAGLPGPADLDGAAADVRRRVQSGERRKGAAAEVAAATGLPARAVYEASLHEKPVAPGT
jgi:16S rRNA (cytidine1402-2'-O)-methyltransferase